MKLAITDDHLVVVKGLTTMLHQIPDATVIFCAHSGEQLISELENCDSSTFPDVLLLDIQLRGLQGTDLCRRILKTYPALKIIALTSHEDPNYVRQMLRNGAKGYLLKNIDIPTLQKALTAVYNGEQFIDEQIHKNIVHEVFTGQRISRYEIPLSKREKEVLKLIGEEMSNQEIADMLFISLRTVESHRFNIIQKLNIKNTAGLVKEALKRGLI